MLTHRDNAKDKDLGHPHTSRIDRQSKWGAHSLLLQQHGLRLCISYLSIPSHHKSWEIPAKQGRKQVCQWSPPTVPSATKCSNRDLSLVMLEPRSADFPTFSLAGSYNIPRGQNRNARAN